VTRLLPALWVVCAWALCSCQQAAPKPLRIAISPWVGYEFLFLAQEKGFLAEAGVGVEIVRTASSGDSRRFYERGLIDGFGATVYELLLAQQYAGEPTAVVYGVDISAGADVILARKPIATVGDLRGKSVMIEQGSVNAVLLHAALQSEGLSLSEMRVVFYNQSEMAHQMRKGMADAAVSFPPFSSDILALPEMQVIYDSSRAPGAIADVFALRGSVISARRNEVRSLVRAIGAAVEYWRQNPTEANAILAKNLGQTPESVAADCMGIRVLGISEQAEFSGPSGFGSKAFHAASGLLQLGGKVAFQDVMDGSLCGELLGGER